MAAVTALTACSLIRLTTSGLVRMLREKPDFAVAFTTYLVAQSIHDQESLVDHLTNRAEKRLARALLLLTGRGGGVIATPINQGILASMIGTTRPRISYFMNKFKKQGFIQYDRLGRVNVHNSLRSVLAGE
jgi:CRP-like cAMP-binding protein